MPAIFFPSFLVSRVQEQQSLRNAPLPNNGLLNVRYCAPPWLLWLSPQSEKSSDWGTLGTQLLETTVLLTWSEKNTTYPVNFRVKLINFGICLIDLNTNHAVTPHSVTNIRHAVFSRTCTEHTFRLCLLSLCRPHCCRPDCFTEVQNFKLRPLE